MCVREGGGCGGTKIITFKFSPQKTITFNPSCTHYIVIDHWEREKVGVGRERQRQRDRDRGRELF